MVPGISLDKIRAIAFDFDGVILDSVQLKADLFVDSYDHPLDSAQKTFILTYQAAYGGVGRVKKFEYFERAVFRREPDPAVVRALAARYGTLLMERIPYCGELPGARTFLNRLKPNLSLHLVSGTSHDDLVRIVADRALTRYFDSVTGAPTGKTEAFTTIADSVGVKLDEVLAIGDSTTEYEAAHGLGMPFVGIVKEGEENPFPPAVPTYANLEKLNWAWY
jgi:phosphoglycolate phosphatase-like HAD superfamily hydrolase